MRYSSGFFPFSYRVSYRKRERADRGAVGGERPLLDPAAILRGQPSIRLSQAKFSFHSCSTVGQPCHGDRRSWTSPDRSPSRRAALCAPKSG